MKCPLCKKIFTITIYKNRSGDCKCPHCLYGFNGKSANEMGKGKVNRAGVQSKQSEQYTSQKKEGYY
jgi:hypothetical protein